MKKAVPQELPSEDEVREASRIIREEFAFVGLTDDWNVSVFLFHAMFGGTPDQADFKNTHKGLRQTKFATNASVAAKQLKESGWQDPYDGPLFMAAKNVVVARVGEYFGDACRKNEGNALCQYMNNWRE